MANVHARIWFAAFLTLITTAGVRPAAADIISGTISLDTSALSGAFELAFVLTDGSGIRDANNVAMLTHFAFGAGGSAGAVDATLSTGGVRGDLLGGASLVDSAFLSILCGFVQSRQRAFGRFRLDHEHRRGRHAGPAQLPAPSVRRRRRRHE